jgi:MoxR-like ATPase
VSSRIAPLVVITTNEERALPDAFVRRCLVLFLSLPADKDALIKLLVARGRAHFPPAEKEVLEAAAEQLSKDRQHAVDQHRLPLPGQAEYLDVMRAVLALAPDQPDRQIQTLKDIAPYTLQKHSGAA